MSEGNTGVPSFAVLCEAADPLSLKIFPPEVEWSAQNTIGATSSHICLPDETGLIIHVNKAWRDFAAATAMHETPH